MNAILRNINKFFNVILLSHIFMCTTPATVFASAWLNNEGEHTLTTSFGYIAPYKSGTSSQVGDNLANISDYSIRSKTDYVSFGAFLEYGFTEDITFIGDVQPTYYNDRIAVTNSFNGGAARSFSLKSGYYDIDSNFGFKEKIYSDQDDYDVLSYQVMLYPGNLIVNDKTDYLSKKFAGKFSLLYGYSFNIPFGTEDRPEYANYIDFELGYKGYPMVGKSEGIANIEFGLKPFGINPLIVFGFYNNFNEYNYTKRPFDQNAINSGINGFGATQQIASIIRSDINSNLSRQANAPYHQINFQLGFSLDPKNTLYLQSFHNVIKNKPFTYNSYYLSLEYKF